MFVLGTGEHSSCTSCCVALTAFLGHMAWAPFSLGRRLLSWVWWLISYLIHWHRYFLNLPSEETPGWPGGLCLSAILPTCILQACPGTSVCSQSSHLKCQCFGRCYLVGTAGPSGLPESALTLASVEDWATQVASPSSHGLNLIDFSRFTALQFIIFLV